MFFSKVQIIKNDTILLSWKTAKVNFVSHEGANLFLYYK